MKNSFGAQSILTVGTSKYTFYRLKALNRNGVDVQRLPYTLRILLENLLRNEDGITVTQSDIENLMRWDPKVPSDYEIVFSPARTLLQDFTGVPAVVDLAAMRDAMVALGGDPGKINPLQPVELVVDHSIHVDEYGTDTAFERNEALDYERNSERYALLRWAQKTFKNFKVVPPNSGIVHQINLEFLSRVVFSTDELDSSSIGPPLAYPDSCVGTDSHTPMVNGLGVLAWGVGGIEAEATMLGQPISMLIPQVIGFKLSGSLPHGATATDLVLTITEMLRKKGVVGKFVEFFGPGISSLSLADRATIGNMSPEYGATCAIFPPDEVTLQYLRLTGRSKSRIALVEAYMKEQGLFHQKNSPEPNFTDVITLDLASIEPCIAGPTRPQDRIALANSKQKFLDLLPALRPITCPIDGATYGIRESSPDRPLIEDGSVVIAAITSCTNTSNPSVMMAAGLLAKKAVELGLKTQPWVKTSLAPGSKVVTRYYESAGLTPYLDELGFNLTGYGCTTCIGNSGPLAAGLSEQIRERGLVATAVLSGNRNFEGRIHPDVRANFLMSPPLVVAFALRGKIDWNPTTEPIGKSKDGRDVFLHDIWPAQQEIEETLRAAIEPSMFSQNYSSIYEGDDRWKAIPIDESKQFKWKKSSTYIRQPTYFKEMIERNDSKAPESVEDILGARAMLVLGDTVTTDHISPAGAIRLDSAAAEYLITHGVEPKDFNSYGSRRGNHAVMVRGTFANSRIRNALAQSGVEGGWTTYLPTNKPMSIFDAAVSYSARKTPLCVLAGKEYGAGSSRDWAAKGTLLQGIKFVVAQSFERIHRSNLVGMGVLPLEFVDGQSVNSLALTGREIFDVLGLKAAIDSRFASGRHVTVRATDEKGGVKEFRALMRIDTPQALLYFLNGGILPFVLRELLKGQQKAPAISRAMSTSAQVSHDHLQGDGSVDRGSIESFPASDPPAY